MAGPPSQCLVSRKGSGTAPERLISWWRLPARDRALPTVHAQPEPPGRCPRVSQSPGRFPGPSAPPTAPLPAGTVTAPGQQGGLLPRPSHPFVSFPGPLSQGARLGDSNPSQVFGICSISIPCLLFMKGRRSICRILSGSGVSGRPATNPPTSATYVILAPSCLTPPGPPPPLSSRALRRKMRG